MKKFQLSLLLFTFLGVLIAQSEVFGQAGNEPNESNKNDLPPGWDYTNTGIVHGIVIPDDAIISIYGNAPTENTWLGVFYVDQSGEEKCGGARKYNPGQSNMLAAFGNDNTTATKDGFSYGEEFIWRIFCGETQTEYRALAVYYSMIHPDCYFGPDLCTLFRLDAIMNFQVELPAGWSGFSLPFTPVDGDPDQIFSDLDDNLIILQNDEYVYWPDAGINTFPAWEPVYGAQIKMTESTNIEIAGIPVAKEIYLSEGWNFLPVMAYCDIQASALFIPLHDQIDIVKTIAGNQVYWPDAGIFTLQTLQAGNAYLIHMNQPAMLIFPDCNP